MTGKHGKWLDLAWHPLAPLSQLHTSLVSSYSKHSATLGMLLGFLCLDFPTCKMGLVTNTSGLEKLFFFSPVHTLFPETPPIQEEQLLKICDTL